MKSHWKPKKFGPATIFLYHVFLLKLNPDGSPIVESEIIAWANNKLELGQKNSNIKHFQDKVRYKIVFICILYTIIKYSREYQKLKNIN